MRLVPKVVTVILKCAVTSCQCLQQTDAFDFGLQSMKRSAYFVITLNYEMTPGVSFLHRTRGNSVTFWEGETGLLELGRRGKMNKKRLRTAALCFDYGDRWTAHR